MTVLFRSDPIGPWPAASGPGLCDSAANGVELDSHQAGTLRISVIIPTLNEEAMIGKCLECLAQSRFPMSGFEVIVADNGSRDRTMEIVRSFARQLRITALQQPGVTISALRNLSAQAAQGEFLAFLDADCLVPDGWLQAALRHIEDPTNRIVGSRYAIPADSSWIGRAWYGVGYAPADGEVAYVPSGDLIVSRATFLQLGGFNEGLATSEDCEFCLRARNAGVPVQAVAELAVTHLGTPQTIRQFYGKHRWHGTHVAKVFWKNMTSAAHFRAVAFALYVLACWIGLIAGLGGIVFVHNYFLFAGAVAGMMIVSVLCSIRKLHKVRGIQFWQNVFPLTALYIVYGTARASSLLMAGSGSRK
jgi:glycosyltransferase involved in cell wall biosynthesis